MNRCKWIKANATWGKPWTTIAEYIPKHWVLAEEYMTMEVGPDGKEYAIVGEVVWWMPIPEVDE